MGNSPHPMDADKRTGGSQPRLPGPVVGKGSFLGRQTTGTAIPRLALSMHMKLPEATSRLVLARFLW